MPGQDSGHRERELKYVLASRGDYDRLLCLGIGVPLGTEEQENYYFDTPERSLLEQGILLRLRRSDRLVLTLKHGGERERAAGYFDALEVEAEAPASLLEAALRRPGVLLELDLPPCAALRERWRGRDLVFAGCLWTTRRRWDVGPFVVEVDRLQFPDASESWELEIETADPETARLWVEREIAARGIRLQPQRRTKREELEARLRSE
jgi:uncharacterized protein YjbK